VREAGVALTLIGLAVVTWFALLTSPEPEYVCGSSSNLVVLWSGYDTFPELPAEAECRRRAGVELAKGLALGGTMAVGGLVLAVAGHGRRRLRDAQSGVTRGAEAGRVRRSEDGSQWWDGYRWHRITPDAPAPPPGAP
jgi:hypothetical protein